MSEVAHSASQQHKEYQSSYYHVQRVQDGMKVKAELGLDLFFEEIREFGARGWKDVGFMRRMSWVGYF